VAMNERAEEQCSYRPQQCAAARLVTAHKLEVGSSMSESFVLVEEGLAKFSWATLRRANARRELEIQPISGTRMVPSSWDATNYQLQIG
jgi:hypothetical protein